MLVKRLTFSGCEIKKESPNEGTETYIALQGSMTEEGGIKKESPNEGTETRLSGK